MKRIHLMLGPVSLASAADAILALGHQPILAWDKEESAEVTVQCDGLFISLAMLTRDRLEAMLESQRIARQKGIPVVFDPVGVGASRFRMEAAKAIVAQGVDLIKGNASEMLQLINQEQLAPGVDAIHSGFEVIDLLRPWAKSKGLTVLLTGHRDYLVSPEYETSWSGPERLADWTGTGCVLGGLLTLALALSPKDPTGQVEYFARTYRELLSQATDREDLTRQLRKHAAAFYPKCLKK